MADVMGNHLISQAFLMHEAMRAAGRPWRIRRLGFRRDIRRGDDLNLLYGGRVRVIRRSARYIWVQTRAAYRA